MKRKCRAIAIGHAYFVVPTVPVQITSSTGLPPKIQIKRSVSRELTGVQSAISQKVFL
jgi:hypothetical protein